MTQALELYRQESGLHVLSDQRTYIQQCFGINKTRGEFSWCELLPRSSPSHKISVILPLFNLVPGDQANRCGGERRFVTSQLI